jgi:Ran GTPase-activating protein (RanGAP) involved in mRNA processing and transport
MSISDDVLAMTFSSEHTPTVSIDGMLMDSQTTSAVLKEAKRRPKVKELTLRSVSIDATVAEAAHELFADPDRVWQKIELIHCTGRNAEIIKASIFRAKHFAFTGSVPIAHNPRYSLDVECMKAVGSALKDCKSLTVLSLKGSRLDRAGLEAFCAGLETSTSLQTLQLSHCALEVPDIPILSSALARNQHLTALSMAHCKIGATPLAEESTNQLCLLLESLVSHPTLQVLNIFGMYCTERAMEALSSLVRAQRSALWHLGLKNNVRHPDDKLTVTGLFRALEDNTALTYLQLSGNNVGDEDMEQLAQIVTASNNTLRALNLTANNIGDDGIISFAKRLAGMKGLRLLDLQRNPFTETSKLEIIAALKDNTELERLDLDGKFDGTKAYYLGLNKGGRRLLQSGNNTPLALWPLVLERTNRLPFNRSLPHAHLDILYNLVRGPALFQSRRKRTREVEATGAEKTDTEEPPAKRARIP